MRGTSDAPLIKGVNAPVEDFMAYHFDEQWRRHEAISLSWLDVEEIIGRPYRGTAEDDIEIIDALVAAGAPIWVDDASIDDDVRYDEYGWTLVGPEIVSTAA